MTALFTATSRHYSAASLGATVPGTDLDVVSHIISDTVEDLEDRVNAALVAFTLAETPLYLACASIGGSGDGHDFCVSVVGNIDGSGGRPAGPSAGSEAGTRAFFYKAETEPELQRQCAACMARITAWIGTGRSPTYVDWQLAGAAKGRVHMGMILVYRASIG